MKRLRIDLERFDDYAKQKYLSRVEHPTLPLILYNYTDKTQYERQWDDVTTIARGLIVDQSGLVVANPFPKFFNLDEHLALFGSLPNQNYTVTEKVYGSLGIAVNYKGTLVVATRGSFTSEQATVARRMIEESGFICVLGLTYLFEIVYPENRIVVDYGETRELVLLGLRHPDGREWSPREGAAGWHWRRAREYTMTLDEAQNYHSARLIEGFVIRFQDGIRVKVKTEEYRTLHKLVSGITPKSLVESLRDGKTVGEVLEGLPDEHPLWDTGRELEETYRLLLINLEDLVSSVEHLPARKEQARVLSQSPLRSAAFLALDGKDPSREIWKVILGGLSTDNVDKLNSSTSS